MDPLMPPPPIRRIVVDAPHTPVVVRRSATATARRVARGRASAPASSGCAPTALTIAYGGKVAVNDVSLPVHQGEVLALIGPSGCGKTTLLRSLNRLVELTPGAGRGGRDPARRRRRRRARGHAPAPAHLDGLPAAEPVPDVDLRQRRVCAARAGLAAGQARGAEAPVREALTRAGLWDEVKRRSRPAGAADVRRPAAAAVHRPRAGRAARGAAARRAVLGAGPALDGDDRGADPRAARGAGGRDRHPQPPAGLPDRRPRRVHVPRRARRVRAGRGGLRAPARTRAPPTTCGGAFG